jgi:hypothetical protein
MKTNYRPRSSLDEQLVSVVTTLPTDSSVAVYYRQSTQAQVGNVSTAIQTVDMREHLKRLGWAEEDILLIDMDVGISGTKKIAERPGMSALFDLIEQRMIGAVACQDEDRLFRDVTMIQVDIFIEACRKNNVLVMTPSMVYDFANPHFGVNSARQFRWKCDMAAEYINTYVKGKLGRAKRHLLMEGRWAGGNIALGYMVDMRERRPDGTRNPNWRRLEPFPPFAEVLREYFELFLRYAGNLRKTVRHIREFGPYPPDPRTTPPPEGYYVQFHTRGILSQGDRYVPSRAALLDMLTNVVYIGFWKVKGAIVARDNHPAIVPMDVFVRAYNYLSEADFDGNPNPHYRPFQQQVRPTKDEERPVDRPLCAGMIV